MKIKEEVVSYEHSISGDAENAGMSETEISALTSSLFEAPPIPFVAKKGDKVDIEIQKLINELKITVPIIWIKEKLYLVGDKRLNLDKNGEFLCANIGGGYKSF